jgi:EpsI family protein
MRQSEICAAICCITLLAACLADYGFGKLPMATPQRLPVESFPTSLGAWQGGDVMPVDPDVQAQLPSAKIIERMYTDPAGHVIDLTLVTANDSLDIHDPSICLPAQGWKILNSSSMSYGSQAANILDLDESGQKMTTVYWWTGCYPPKLSNHIWVQYAAKIQKHFVHARELDSLMVRIMSDSNTNSNATLNNFVQSVMPAVKQLTDKGITPS